MGLTGLRVSSKKKDRPKNFENKLDKKLGFYAKVKNAAASDPKKKDAAISLGPKKTISKKKRSRQKKLKAYDLSVLSEFLPDLKPPKVTDLKLNCKSRQKIVQRETAQMRAVLNDSSFQANPISAIHQYLERTQPPPEEKQSRGKQTGKKRKRNKKKTAKEASSGSQSMDL